MEQNSLSAVQRTLIERLRGAGAGAPAGTQPLGGIPAPERSTEAEAAPLSFGQERVWQAHLRTPDAAFLNVVFAGEVSDWDEDSVEHNIDRLVARQDVLRSVFPLRDGQPVQRTLPHARVTVPRVDLAETGDPEQAWDALVARQRETPFDPTTGPLYRAVLARLDERRLRLLFVMHELVADGFSVSLVTAQLMSPVDSPLPLRYADYARWQREQVGGERWERELTFWRAYLADRPEPAELPTDLVRPREPSPRGDMYEHTLSTDLARRVREVAGRLRATPFTVLLAAFGAFLHQVTGERDVMLGSTVLGRTEPQLRDLVGFLSNKVALRVSVQPQAAFADLVVEARDAVTKVMSHQEVPYLTVAGALAPPVAEDRPLFRILFNMPGVMPEIVNLRVPVPGLGTGSVHDLHLMVLPTVDSLQLVWNYRTELYHESTIRRYTERYVDMVDALTTDPSRQLSTLEAVANRC
jgi:hypothetical protein